jgi:hypothetical protein
MNQGGAVSPLSGTGLVIPGGIVHGVEQIWYEAQRIAKE